MTCCINYTASPLPTCCCHNCYGNCRLYLHFFVGKPVDIIDNGLVMHQLRQSNLRLVCSGRCCGRCCVLVLVGLCGCHQQWGTPCICTAHGSLLPSLSHHCIGVYMCVCHPWGQLTSPPLLNLWTKFLL